jgi:acyl-CoA synthetase (NDP forming)
MPTMMSAKNPIDIIGDADSARVGQILQNIATARKKADIIFLFTIQATTDIDTIANSISDFYKNHKEYTIFVGLIGGDTIKTAQSKLLKEGIFVGTSTESIISAYTHLLREKTKDIQPKGIQKTITPKKDHTIAALMNQNDSEKLLKEYNIQTTHTNEYESLEDILSYVQQYDGPFVMKIGGKNMIHKTELG